MGEAGRKLTIRMPDTGRPTSAEVTALHVEAGGRALVGAPVMTLRARRREHVVHAPGPGRIVPLVGPGDRVQGGDPLYVLNLDEAALARHDGDARALVATERARRAGAPEGERGRRPSPGVPGWLLAAGGGPALAIACVGIAAAVLHWQTGPDDLTTGRAGERLAAMPWQGETPVDTWVVAPEPAPVPAAAENSGVHAGPSDGAVLDPAKPRSRLAWSGGPAPGAHGVTVRPWGRQNPAMASGEPPRHAPADARPSVQAAPSEIVAAWPMPLGVAGPAGSPPPGAPERIAAAAVSVQ